MMGKTHLKVGIMYYFLISWLTTVVLIPAYSIKVTILGIAAAGVGALFPDADTDHSIINNRNPIFKASNNTINRFNKLLKKIIGFIFFAILGILIFVYMYKAAYYPKQFIILSMILFVLAFNSIKVGKYVPGLSRIYKSIDRGTLRIKKLIMISVYISIGIACIYFSRGQIKGVVWGVIFALIAIFPHRTFLHAPEGLVLSTIGVKYLADIINMPYLTAPFFIGFFSHIYLGDIFTNSGVPISSLPVILRKTGIHEKLKQYVLYKNIYNLLNIKLKVPIIKTGSKIGSIFEWLYIVSLFILVIIVYKKT